MATFDTPTKPEKTYLKSRRTTFNNVSRKRAIRPGNHSKMIHVFRRNVILVLPKGLLGSFFCSVLRWPPSRGQLWWRLNGMDRGYVPFIVCRWVVDITRTCRWRWMWIWKGIHLSENVQPWSMVCLSDLWSKTKVPVLLWWFLCCLNTNFLFYLWILLCLFDLQSNHQPFPATKGSKSSVCWMFVTNRCPSWYDNSRWCEF